MLTSVNGNDLIKYQTLNIPVDIINVGFIIHYVNGNEHWLII